MTIHLPTPPTATPLSLNIRGKLYSLATPKVMGIVNITPDSFYAESRKQDEKEIAQRIEEILAQGGDIIDIGAYSSRPGCAEVTEEEELKRVLFALKIARRISSEIPISIDTFRSQIARISIEEGADIINDISAGTLDTNMFHTVASLKVPYIAMHMQGTPQEMQQHTTYGHITGELLQYFGEKIAQLTQIGVKDIIIDPGFGFSKTLDQNYQLLHDLHEFTQLNTPLLVGISRKSMIYKLLQTTPQESLTGTTAIHTIALLQGANILRVHDVKEAKEIIQIVNKTTISCSILE